MREVEPGSGVGRLDWVPALARHGRLDMGGEFALLTECPRYNRHCARRDAGS